MSKLIMAKVTDLSISPNYGQIYQVDNVQREILCDSISENGVLEPVVITRDNVIINGVQRMMACKELGLKEIPARILEIPSDADLMFLLINFNRNRVKSVLEIWNEITYLKAFYQKKQGQRTDLIDGATEFDKMSTREKLALHLGISAGNVYKIEYIAQYYLKGFELITKGESSINNVYKQLRESQVQVENEAKLQTENEAKSLGDKDLLVHEMEENNSNEEQIRSVSDEADKLADKSDDDNLIEEEQCTCPNCRYKFNPSLIF